MAILLIGAYPVRDFIIIENPAHEKSNRPRKTGDQGDALVSDGKADLMKRAKGKVGNVENVKRVKGLDGLMVEGLFC